MKAVNIIILIAGSFYICGSFLIEKKEPEKVTYELQEEDFHSQRQKDTGDGIADGIASIGAIAEEKSLTGSAKKKGLIASLKDKKFIVLFIIAYCVPLYLVYLVLFMKIIFMPIIQDDGYLAMCSVVLTISGMIGAPFWGIVADKKGFKKTLLLVTITDLVTKFIGLGCT